MYPIKIKKRNRKVILKELFLNLIEGSKKFITSLKSPICFIRFLRKSFYF